jgi:multisubunit Na+/H+ antiporter MnhC subunit
MKQDETLVARLLNICALTINNQKKSAMSTKQIITTVVVTVGATILALWIWKKIENRKKSTDVAKA